MTGAPTKHVTVYFDPALPRSSFAGSRDGPNPSDLVNDAIRAALAADAKHIDAFEDRKSEPE